tara:strand:+ start:3318 stop:4088 length:771 start_codon:yes stop_codon:yes gene_type:complete
MRNWFQRCEKIDFDDESFCGYFFAEVSALAYLDWEQANPHIKALGFDEHKFLDVDGAQCHIFHDDNDIVVAFRGTEPKQWSDVKADLLALKRKSSSEGRVHLGFLREINKLWNYIKDELDDKPDHQIWVCGHSLGGAMATLCAYRLRDSVPILYTYGSPRVGGSVFVDSCDVEHHRYQNNNDVVPTVPFWLMGFRHHGELHYINYYGNIRTLTFWQKFKDSVRGRCKALTKFQLFDGVYDHNITEGYADKLMKHVI